ncbi:MAG: hypothetical protein Tsb0034_29230 [Ekhidna sp.]
MKNFQNTFEYNVLRVACFIGLVRSIIEVVGDFLAVELLPNFYLDLAFIFVFSGTLIALGKRFPYKRILFLFYIPFVILLWLMFIDADGLAYSVENNVFAGVIIITFTMRKKMPLYFNAALIAGILIGLVFIEYQHHFLERFIPHPGGSFNFVFSSVGVIAFTLYAKTDFTRKKNELAAARKSLDEHHQQLKEKNEELVKQKVVLENLTVSLDNQVKSRSKKLKSQKKQVEQYLSISMTELFDAYQKTVTSIEELDKGEEQDHITSMVVQSGERLKIEMDGLRNKIDESIHEVG